MTITTLYLAGPMSSLPEHNFPAFHAAQAELEAAGYTVLSPTTHGSGEASWAHYLRKDLRMVLDAEGLAVLPGWENSRGAIAEVYVARILDMPVRPVADWAACPRAPHCCRHDGLTVL